MAMRKKVIDPESVRKLAAMHCTNEEIAGFFNMTCRNWLARYANTPKIREAIDAGRAQGKVSLRRKQFDIAMSGNVTMNIWLGKQYLGQKDIVINEHTEGLIADGEDARDALKRSILSVVQRRRSQSPDKPPDAGTS